MANTPPIWVGDGRYVVETGVENGLRMGRLVDPEGGSVGDELPVDSIAHYMPYTEWLPYEGDPAPFLALLAAHLGGRATSS